MARPVSGIDLVVVNLSFEQTFAKPTASLPRRSKTSISAGLPDSRDRQNHKSVGVVVDPNDYPQVLAELAQAGVLDDMRFKLAVSFRHTSAYDSAIAAYLAKVEGSEYS